MRLFKNKICFLILSILLVLPQVALAKAPYSGYNYNAWDEPVPAPNGYVPDRVFTGKDLGIGDFKTPQDMFVTKDSELYILDSGNNRIVVLDSDLKLKRVMDEFRSEKGEEKLSNPKGIFVGQDGIIYVADTGNERVVVMDHSGIITRVLTKPDSDIFPQELKYQPQKLVVTSAGTVYVLCYGLFQGAVVYGEDGSFKGFFGSNLIQTTSEILTELFWKRILTKEQREKMMRFVPIEYSNMDVDEEDFIYTCSKVVEKGVDQIKKLNPAGKNILKASGGGSIKYGDLMTSVLRGKTQDTAFIDVEIDEKGFINALDAGRGRIFQYNQESDLLTVFGGLGDQKGTFKSPVAVESLCDIILVLDETKASITTFKLTGYGELLHEAILLYGDGLYQESVALWQEVLKANIHSKLAYRGIAKTMMQTGRYREAMKYFKLCNDREGYSDAFKEYRTDLMRSYFSLIMTVILLLILLVWADGRVHFVRKAKKSFTNRLGRSGKQ